MVVRIRFARFGCKNKPFYRVMAADSRSPRDGKHLEVLGYYNPLPGQDGGKRMGLNFDRVKYWLSVGAQASEPVQRILFRAGLLPPPPMVAMGRKGGERDTRPIDPMTGRFLENPANAKQLKADNAVSAPYVEEKAETVTFPRFPPPLHHLANGPTLNNKSIYPGRALSYGLNWALARRGVVVKDKAFQNLTSSELQQKGATIAESLSGLPVHVKGNLLGGSPDISKAQYTKLLKQVTTHLSSISNVFVQDGATGSSSDCDTKVRVISDSPSAVLKLSSILWKTPSRAVSHDSCPLIVYIAASISPGVGDAIGLRDQGNNGFIAADIERSSLILCGKAFSDVNGIKDVLAALSGPIITARGGLLLSARLLECGDSVILLFAPEDTIQSCANLLVSVDPGVILASQGVAPLFQTGNPDVPDTFKLPVAAILASSDSSGIIPSVAKLSPGQAAYHFLAGYQSGKFIPAYSKLLHINALEIAKAFLSKLKNQQISSYLINVKRGETSVTGNDLSEMVQSILSNNIPPFEPKGGELQEKYKSFLSGKFQEIPKEFSF